MSWVRIKKWIKIFGKIVSSNLLLLILRKFLAPFGGKYLFIMKKDIFS